MKLKLLLLTAIVTLTSACTTNQLTGRKQLLMTSVDQENEMGAQAWEEIQKKEKETSNKDQTDAVLRVGKEIAEVTTQYNFDWEFKVFESEQANAFCLPGGKVAVYTGLLKFTANDAELATVIGHEVAHAVLRHGGERMSQGALQQIGAELLRVGEVGDAWLQAYGIAASGLAILPYSRKHEYEADEVGLTLLARAGYNPEAALSFWGKFGADSDSSSFAELFSTHPMSEKRLKEMRKQLPKAMQIYNTIPEKHNLGVIY